MDWTLWRYDGLGYLDGVAKVLLSYLEILNLKFFFVYQLLVPLILRLYYGTQQKLNFQNKDERNRKVKECGILPVFCAFMSIVQPPRATNGQDGVKKAQNKDKIPHPCTFHFFQGLAIINKIA